MPVKRYPFKSQFNLPTMVCSLLLSCIVSIPASFADERLPAAAPVLEECKRIGNKLGSVSTRQCLNANLQDSGARSVQGQAIMHKEYPPMPDRDPIGRVLLIGGTHGDEYSSVSIVFKWLRTLDAHHSGMFHWHVVPLLNPDGLLQRHSQRLNANGIDLNRNMPTPDWHNKTAAYWKKTGFDPRRKPGSDPLSEPESRWLYEEIRQFKPHVIVSVHAPYNVLDFDGPPVGPSKLGQLHLKLIGTYPGSLGNCAGVQHEIPVITVELPHAGIMPTQQQISRMWGDLIHWMRNNIPKTETLKAHNAFDDIAIRLMQRPENSQDKQPLAAPLPPSEKPVNMPAHLKQSKSDQPHPNVHVHEQIGNK